MLTTAAAVEHLRVQFKVDPDYRHTWACNIAMSIYAEFVNDMMDDEDLADLHRKANAAADRFLQLLENRQ
jgi:hypothetical protein